MDIPIEVRQIVNTLEDKGYEAYIVGGCVRDRLTGRTPSDWDVATAAPPACVKQIFPRTFDTGIKHGTVSVLLGGATYEVTTYRVDGEYADFRRPEAVFFTNELTEDLSRRDFTVNAIAYHPEKGFVDPFGGKADITRKILRAVRDPNERFQEDALRMLRAVRFSAQLDFEIEEETQRGISKNAGLIIHISMERIREELTKLLLSPQPEKLAMLDNSGLLAYIFPSLAGYFDEHLDFILTCLKAAELTGSPGVMFAYLFQFLTPQETEKNMERLTFDRNTVRETAHYVRWINEPIECSPYGVRKAMCLCGSVYFEAVLAMRETLDRVRGLETGTHRQLQMLRKEITANRDCLSIKDLAVSGHDMKQLGIPQGEKLGAALHALLEHVLRDPSLNTKELLLPLAAEWISHGTNGGV